MKNTRIERLKQSKRVKKVTKVLTVSLLVCPLAIGTIKALADEAETTSQTEQTAQSEAVTMTEESTQLEMTEQTSGPIQIEDSPSMESEESPTLESYDEEPTVSGSEEATESSQTTESSDEEQNVTITVNCVDEAGNLLKSYTETAKAGENTEIYGDYALEIDGFSYLILGEDGEYYGSTWAQTVIAEEGKVITFVYRNSVYVGLHTIPTLEIGETWQCEYWVSPENAPNKTVRFESSNPEVATVDANGLVTAISQGSFTIYATPEANGTQGYYYSHVVEKEADTTKLRQMLNKASDKLQVGGYTTDSIKVLNSAMDIAEEIYFDPYSTQVEVDKATTDLEDAIAKLVIDDDIAKKIKEADEKIYQLNNRKNGLQNNSSMSDEDQEAMQTSSSNAIENLSLYKWAIADTTWEKVQAAITAYEAEIVRLETLYTPVILGVAGDLDRTYAQEILAQYRALVKTEYTRQSWYKMQIALGMGQDAQGTVGYITFLCDFPDDYVLPTIPEDLQLGLDSHVEHLVEAMALLIKVDNPIPPTEEVLITTNLTQTISKAEKLSSADYTADSWAKFITALNNAKDILSRAEEQNSLTRNTPVTQADIDQALSDLETAIANLAKKDGSGSNQGGNNSSNDTGNSSNDPNTSSNGATNNTNNQTNNNQNSTTTTTKPAGDNTSKDGLPQTGEQSTTNAVIAGLSLTMLSILAWLKRKKV
ncbi:Ig-like domain-containing protein [Enterococcus sp. BWM-S5]|uniref:Ig-like domain-containing protein n=1 Tax=Enterococcus larvae TaxID=2794352 RepID=A0ABS4CHX6_9ENTE|nr:Ig-like domain-containing protein [Enterococcus larvae]MBP1046161.1 Ig-like domain-containing protein [Enterococcus larvae]